MPNINLDDAYVLDETGAQVDKVTGLFTKDEDTTSVEKAFAQLNIGTAGSNRNLLDNAWWGLNEVINQRENTNGQTTHNAYSIDRWKMSYGNALGTWSIAADGITITSASGTYALFQQPLANPSALLGKTVTCSILFADGTIASGTVENITWTGNPVVFTYRYARVQLLNEGTFRVTILSGGSETIRAVKLELGSVSTLANDAPPNYAEELAKCQRYFFRLKTSNYPCVFAIGRLVAPTQARITIPTPVSMRDNGTITATLNGNILVIDAQQNASAAITSVSASCVMSNGVTILANLGASLGGGHIATMETSSTSAYIDLSADL